MSFDLEEIKRKYQAALVKLDLNIIQEIISELNSLSSEDKQKGLSLYSKISEDLFQLNVSVNNYDSDAYLNTINEWKQKKKKEVTKESNGLKAAVTVNDFNDAFLLFHKNTEKVLVDLKSHFIFLLDNNSINKTRVIILTDETFYNHPLIERIKKYNGEAKIDKFKIADFIDQCKSDPELTNEKFLCLALISPNLNQDEATQTLVRGLFELFQKSSIVQLKKSENVQFHDYDLKKIDADILSHIEFTCNMVLNNKDILYEEEIIIKKLFGKNTSIIDYKILKGGNSGSKVIEVRPIKNLSYPTSRFVVKFARKDAHRKIKTESEAFKSYIEDFTIPGYGCSYEQTEQYEAIKYKYASSDGISDSYSYASLVKNFIDTKPAIYDLQNVLEQLFSCAPFQVWNSGNTVDKTIGKLYSDYLDENKICRSIRLITNLDDEEVKRMDLWKEFVIIKKAVVKVKEKVCHGDLHTENFFKDDNGVYLIDFGYTDWRHSVIDHTTLEASLKFKHIPFYIDIHELIELEKKFLGLDSSQEMHELEKIKRAPLKEVFKLILAIRKESTKLLVDSNKPLEYYISLFIITLRQIQYSDLNQLYALESAKYLAKYIVEKLTP